MSAWPPEDEIGARLITALREEAADRPAHARFLVDLERTATQALAAGKGEDGTWEALDDLPVPRGVSARVAQALITDVDWIVAWILQPKDDPSKRRSQYERAYANRRSTDAAAAIGRQRARERGPRLEDMLNLKKGPS